MSAEKLPGPSRPGNLKQIQSFFLVFLYTHSHPIDNTQLTTEYTQHPAFIQLTSSSTPKQTKQLDHKPTNESSIIENTNHLDRRQN
jgi:hypothetical protein